jgi:hypothetical protein
VDRLIPYIDSLPEHLAGRVGSAVADAKGFYLDFNQYLLFFRHENSTSRSKLVRRSLFIAMKNELAEKQGKATQMRIKLDGIYNAVIQRSVLAVMDVVLLLL